MTPSSYPDWGKASPLGTIVPVADIGELAARLGSIVTFDRRGNVFWLDDFEDNMARWFADASGSGSVNALSADRSRSGDTCCKITTGTVSPYTLSLLRSFPLPAYSKWGLEFSFSGVGRATNLQMFDIASLDFYLSWRDGAAEWWARYRFLPATEELQIYKSDATWQTIATGLKLASLSYLFHTVKIVADPSAGAHVRIILNDKSYDTSAYPAWSGFDNTSPRLTLAITVTGDAAGARTCYIDDAILTQNEP